MSNQVKKDPSKIKQADIKASSEIHKIAKEARYGKSPDTVIIPVVGEYSPQELEEMTIEQLEKLIADEESKAIDVPVAEALEVDKRGVIDV